MSEEKSFSWFWHVTIPALLIFSSGIQIVTLVINRDNLAPMYCAGQSDARSAACKSMDDGCYCSTEDGHWENVGPE